MHEGQSSQIAIATAFPRATYARVRVLFRTIGRPALPALTCTHMTAPPTLVLHTLCDSRSAPTFQPERPAAISARIQPACNSLSTPGPRRDRSLSEPGSRTDPDNSVRGRPLLQPLRPPNRTLISRRRLWRPETTQDGPRMSGQATGGRVGAWLHLLLRCAGAMNSSPLRALASLPPCLLASSLPTTRSAAYIRPLHDEA